jgi:hypothetical protein
MRPDYDMFPAEVFLVRAQLEIAESGYVKHKIF